VNRVPACLAGVRRGASGGCRRRPVALELGLPVKSYTLLSQLHSESTESYNELRGVNRKTLVTSRVSCIESIESVARSCVLVIEFLYRVIVMSPPNGTGRSRRPRRYPNPIYRGMRPGVMGNRAGVLDTAISIYRCRLLVRKKLRYDGHRSPALIL